MRVTKICYYFVLALGFGTGPATAQTTGYEFVCPDPQIPNVQSAAACIDYPNSLDYFTQLGVVLRESTNYIESIAGLAAESGDIEFLLIPREQMSPSMQSEFPPGQLAVGQRRAANIGTDAETVALRENANARLFSVPALARVVARDVTPVLDHGCGSWLYNPLLATVAQYNAARYTGVDVLGYINATGNTPRLNNSLTTPDGKRLSGEIDAFGETTLTCESDPVEERILRSANKVSAAWSIFYDQMASVLLGDNADGRSRAIFLLSLVASVPNIVSSLPASVDAKTGTVVALDAVLGGKFSGRDLTEIYPATMARFFDPDRPELLAPTFFDGASNSILRVGLGETVERIGEGVEDLGTTPYVARLERGSAGATRRLVVDVSVSPAFPEQMEDIHIIVNGKVYSDPPGLLVDPEDPTIRAIVTLNDPSVDRAYIAVVQVPGEINAATISDRLIPLAYNLEVTLEEVDLCDIQLFNDFTNPRLARASGNIAADGSNNMAWISKELGPRTSSEITFASPERGVANATVCIDHLLTTSRGNPVISMYTPSPLSQIGGGFSGLTVEHGGWEGWPANSTFKLMVILPDVTVDELREGRTYRAVLPPMMSEGFSSIYTDYQGRFTGPGPNDFEGSSFLLVAKGAQGMFAVTDADAGFLRGNLTLAGPAEVIVWEHTRLEDGRYMMDGEDHQSTLSISGEIAIEATDDSLRLIREGGELRSTVID